MIYIFQYSLARFGLKQATSFGKRWLKTALALLSHHLIILLQGSFIIISILSQKILAGKSEFSPKNQNYKKKSPIWGRTPKLRTLFYKWKKKLQYHMLNCLSYTAVVYVILKFNFFSINISSHICMFVYTGLIFAPK